MSEYGTAFPIRTPRSGMLWRLALIGAVVAALAAAFAYVGGWLTPRRLTPGRIVDTFEQVAGRHPGFRRNHAKGVCVTGYFEGSGAASAYSRTALFGAGQRTPVGRFALPGGNPYAPDASVPIRSPALRFTLADGEQWRTGMNSMPVFPVATPQAFYEQLRASRPDPRTGKPDPGRMRAFFAAHPETRAFRAWASTARPSASYATEAYNALDAFYFVDADGRRHAVRWGVVPEAAGRPDAVGPAGPDGLAQDLVRRLAQGPLRWHLRVTLAAPGDLTDDASRAWPADRPQLDAGTLVLERTEPQDAGPCRDVNYDPLVLPQGIEASDDPLLPARSAVYADSHERRTGEETGVSPPRTAPPTPAREPRA
ncbi:catalase family peroxidase [Fulvimonas yonginensis]|uniref:Catalase-related peroxidase n=1 Tax=Fulvimonas yonginensis TaxID=1495200 RepID=A0ABU8JFE3_9GAMM